MTPEILHRCESCGATIREAAMFCPECGKPLAVAKQEEPSLSDKASAGPPIDRTASTSAQSTALSGVENHAANSDQVVPVDSAKGKNEPLKAATPERHGARERTRETLHRASTAARGAIERPVKQVDPSCVDSDAGRSSLRSQSAFRPGSAGTVYSVRDPARAEQSDGLVAQTSVCVHSGASQTEVCATFQWNTLKPK